MRGRAHHAAGGIGFASGLVKTTARGATGAGNVKSGVMPYSFCGISRGSLFTRPASGSISLFHHPMIWRGRGDRGQTPGSQKKPKGRGRSGRKRQWHSSDGLTTSSWRTTSSSGGWQPGGSENQPPLVFSLDGIRARMERICIGHGRVGDCPN